MAAYELERVLELRLEAVGCPRSAPIALQGLTPIRMVRTRLGDGIIDCVVQHLCPPGAPSRSPAGAQGREVAWYRTGKVLAVGLAEGETQSAWEAVWE
ncbi:MAG: hypothetical protein AB7Y46_04190 [Armatimonadota bacterium]